MKKMKLNELFKSSNLLVGVICFSLFVLIVFFSYSFFDISVKGTYGDLVKCLDGSRAIDGGCMCLKNTLAEGENCKENYVNNGFSCTSLSSSITGYAYSYVCKPITIYYVTFFYDTTNGNLDLDKMYMKVQVNDGSLVSKPANPTKDGYLFDKWIIWNTNTEYNFNNAVTQNIQLIATWKEKSSFTFKEVASNGKSSDFCFHSVGATCSVIGDPGTISNKKFIGWSKNSSCTSLLSSNKNYSFTNSGTYYACWKYNGEGCYEACGTTRYWAQSENDAISYFNTRCGSAGNSAVYTGIPKSSCGGISNDKCTIILKPGDGGSFTSGSGCSGSSCSYEVKGTVYFSSTINKMVSKSGYHVLKWQVNSSDTYWTSSVDENDCGTSLTAIWEKDASNPPSSSVKPASSSVKSSSSSIKPSSSSVKPASSYKAVTTDPATFTYVVNGDRCWHNKTFSYYKVVYINSCQKKDEYGDNALCSTKDDGNIYLSEVRDLSDCPSSSSSSSYKAATTDPATFTYEVNGDRCWHNKTESYYKVVYVNNCQKKADYGDNALCSTKSDGNIYLNEVRDLSNCKINGSSASSVVNNSSNRASSEELTSNKPSGVNNSNENVSSKTNSNVSDNPKTGATMIIVSWLVGLAALGISFFYYRKNSLV